LIPSPDAALGDGDAAARHLYLEWCVFLDP